MNQTSSRLGIPTRFNKLGICSKFKISDVARQVTLRIDAKQAAERFVKLDQLLDTVPTFVLNDVLPKPFAKGTQPKYLSDGEEGIPVVSTLAVRPLLVAIDRCKRISVDDFEALGPSRKLRDGDVLLTLDGGTSIGKAAVLQLKDGDDDDRITMDTHVAALRPEGISPATLAFLLCSPMGQLQFQRAESGASGQTSVSEEDVRRFRFPLANERTFSEAADALANALQKAQQLEDEAKTERAIGWESFQATLMNASGAG